MKPGSSRSPSTRSSSNSRSQKSKKELTVSAHASAIQGSDSPQSSKKSNASSPPIVIFHPTPKPPSASSVSPPVPVVAIVPPPPPPPLPSSSLPRRRALCYDSGRRGSRKSVSPTPLASLRSATLLTAFDNWTRTQPDEGDIFGETMQGFKRLQSFLDDHAAEEPLPPTANLPRAWDASKPGLSFSSRKSALRAWDAARLSLALHLLPPPVSRHPPSSSVPPPPPAFEAAKAYDKKRARGRQARTAMRKMLEAEKALDGILAKLEDKEKEKKKREEEKEKDEKEQLVQKAGHMSVSSTSESSVKEAVATTSTTDCSPSTAGATSQGQSPSLTFPIHVAASVGSSSRKCTPRARMLSYYASVKENVPIAKAKDGNEKPLSEREVRKKKFEQLKLNTDLQKTKKPAGRAIVKSRFSVPAPLDP